MRLTTLGALELDGAPSPGPKPLLLLAYLALEGPKERRFLAELLWRNASDPRNRLSTTLSRLRRSDPGLLRADATTVASAVATDAQEFLRAWREGRWADAVGLYGGPFLEGVDAEGSIEVEEWIYEKREMLATRCGLALLELGESEARRGANARALRWAEEALRRLRSLAASVEPEVLGRLHALLRATGSPLARTVAAEAADLGVELQAEPARLQARSGELRIDAAALPARSDAPLGRSEELERLLALLVDPSCRLVTLLGVGGVGKTRLALEAARRVRESRATRDGVAFAHLGVIREPHRVLPALVRLVGLHDRTGREAGEVLASALGDRELLLVLDNFEQVLAAGPEIAELLSRCSGVTILATSRAPLRVSGERRFPLEPLPLPRPGAPVAALAEVPAVALFRERAAAVDPSFRLTAENGADVAELCVRLDGLPLALELAAARIRLFSPAQMRARLQQRFDLLSRGPRDAAERHASLRAALDWSYDLLNEDEQRLLRSLSVFVAPFTVEVAEAVAPEGAPAPDLLEALVEHSLVRSHSRAPRRFSLLETVRAYGLERLERAGEREDAERAKSAHLLVVADEAAGGLTGPRQGEWFARFEELHADLRASLDFLTDAGDAGAALRLAAALWRYWVAQGHMHEGREHLERLLALREAGAERRARAEALVGLGTILQQLGDPKGARVRLLEALGLWEAEEDEGEVASTLNSLGWLALNLGDLWEAEAHSKRALELHDAHANPRGRAVSLNNLGWIAIYRGEARRAAALLEESLGDRRRAGDERGAAFARTNFAWALRLLGRIEESAALLSEAEAELRVLGDDQLVGWMRYHQAHLALESGRLDEAAERAQESRELIGKVGNRSGLALTFACLAEIRRRQERPAEAADLARRALELAAEVDERWTRGVASLALGRALLACHREEAAHEPLRSALKLRWELGDRPGAAEVMEELARVHHHQRRAERAKDLLRVARALRARDETPPISGTRLPPPRRAERGGTAGGEADADSVVARELESS